MRLSHWQMVIHGLEFIFSPMGLRKQTPYLPKLGTPHVTTPYMIHLGDEMSGRGTPVRSVGAPWRRLAEPVPLPRPAASLSLRHRDG